MKRRQPRTSVRTADDQQPVQGRALPRGAARSGFRILAVLSPLLLLVVLELGLRIGGVGTPTAFFLKLEREGQSKLIQNPRFGWRYFPPALARSPMPISLSAPKPTGTYRVFVLGESAAMGDPEPAYGLARQLERLLQARHSDKRFEVVNVAMTAINSHVIRDIAADCASAQGDCWVIYAGNNEVVGPFGAGTIFGKQAPALPAVRLNLALKKTRLGQLLGGLHQPKGAPVEWQGMEMFLQQKVARDDPRLARVYGNFGRNLDAIIDSGTRSGAKVIVSTMPVNLADCPPFASGHRSGLSADQRTEWDRSFEKGRSAERENRYAEALEAYSNAAKIDAEHAELVFRRAVCRMAIGDPEGASGDFLLARDLDVLRFRADSRLNAIVRERAAAARVPFVDAERESFRHSVGQRSASNPAVISPTPIPGDALFYDHVHLNFSGTFWLAGLLLPEIERALFSGVTSAADAGPNEAELAGRLAFTDYDRRLVLEEMRARLQQAPFSGQGNFSERDALWSRRIKELTALPTSCVPQYLSALEKAPDDWVLHARFGQLLEAAGDQPAAASEWRQVAKLMPREPEAFFHLGNLAQNRGALEEAEQLFQEALERRPESIEALNGLGLLLRSRGRVPEALRYFETALRFNPRFAAARINLAVSLADQGRVAEAKEQYAALLRADSNNVAARVNLAKLLAGEGRAEEAAALYREAVKLDPGSAMARYNLANVLCTQQKFDEAIPHYFAAVKAKPDFAEARYNLGLELARTGRLPEATEQFSEVVRLQPAHADAHFNYGVALARQRRFTEAVREFKETLKLQPSHPSAAEMLQRALKLADTGG